MKVTSVNAPFIAIIRCAQDDRSRGAGVVAPYDAPHILEIATPVTAYILSAVPPSPFSERAASGIFPMLPHIPGRMISAPPESALFTICFLKRAIER